MATYEATILPDPTQQPASQKPPGGFFGKKERVGHMKKNKRDDHRHCLRFNAEEIRMMEEAMQECENGEPVRAWEPGEGLAFGRWMLLDTVDYMTKSGSRARDRRIVESVRRERWRLRRQSTSPKTARRTRVQKESVIS